MPRDDDDELGTVFEYDSFDEAVAAALAQLPNGGTLTIHEETCALAEDEDDDCDCTPWDLPIGAKA